MQKFNTDGFGMRDPRPNRPLLEQGECWGPMLTSIGERLKTLYASEASQAMPDRLQGLVQDLVSAERRFHSKATR
jgi:hypothetical protein